MCRPLEPLPKKSSQVTHLATWLECQAKFFRERTLIFQLRVP